MTSLRPKRITRSSIVGEQGIALIRQRVLEMGYLWYPTGGVEAGIDGLIELRDPATRVVRNSIVQVQSRATEDVFDGETDSAFFYVCDERDLDYWLNGNAPVILVRSRPKTHEAYWVAVKEYFNDPSKRKSRKIAFDKTTTKFDISAQKPLWKLAVPSKEFEKLVMTAKPDEVVATAASWFIERFKYLDENHKLDVLVCAAPMQLVPRISEEALTPLEVFVDADSEQQALDFHNHLKAKGMSIAKPIQIVLPMTYDESKRLKAKRNPTAVRRLQDEATRAWNIHTALYYKAKGIPWRLPRDSSQFTSCYVGISFYESLDKAKLLTSVAEVFNQRGEGMVVRGGPAKLVKEDRQVHIDALIAHDLLRDALDAYRNVHHNLPARLVVHKTSTFDEAETDGFQAVAKKFAIHTLELVSIRDSLMRFYREGKYPPLRGTMMALDDSNAILYTKGSVEFFSTYPGMYVPLSLAFRLDEAEQTTRFHAEEILALTKMNWNNTQFDGFEPITIRAARQVGKILKYVGEHDPMQPHYSFYM